MTAQNKNNKSNKSENTATEQARAPFAFEYNSERRLLIPQGDVPANWQEDQAFLSDMSEAKNKYKDCVGAEIGSHPYTPVHREGRFIVRTSRGFGDTSGKVIANKRKGEDLLSSLLGNRSALLSQLDSEISALETKLSEARALRDGLTKGNAA